MIPFCSAFVFSLVLGSEEGTSWEWNKLAHSLVQSCSLMKERQICRVKTLFNCLLRSPAFRCKNCLFWDWNHDKKLIFSLFFWVRRHIFNFVNYAKLEITRSVKQALFGKFDLIQKAKNELSFAFPSRCLYLCYNKILVEMKSCSRNAHKARNSYFKNKFANSWKLGYSPNDFDEIFTFDALIFSLTRTADHLTPKKALVERTFCAKFWMYSIW